MTVEVKETFKIKKTTKEHPNATKYPGRQSMEFGSAVRQFMCELSAQQLQEFAEDSLVFEEEVTSEFYDSILEGDVVGVGLFTGLNAFGLNPNRGPSAHKFKILKINAGEDTMLARDVTFEHPKSKTLGEEVTLTFELLSCAFGMGFGEILERDGKPYGVPLETEIEVKIYGEKTEEVTDNSVEK